jgi:hypothetical protein
MDLLFANLAKHATIRRSFHDLDIQQQILLCLQTIINFEVGMDCLMHTFDSLNTFVMVMDFKVQVTKPVEVVAPSESNLTERKKKRASKMPFKALESMAEPLDEDILLTMAKKEEIVEQGNKMDQGQIKLNHLRSQIMFLCAIICHYSSLGHQLVLAAFGMPKILSLANCICKIIIVK